ncbi:MAG: hypothetical protein Q7K45_07205 [Nanoarchaeota archaeon]|nr:hypothetical protein [Nanoarchaeota archaeon]
MTFKDKLKHIYEQKYKTLLIIPMLLVVFAIAQISIQYATTGDFVNKGISLQGGSTISFPIDSSFTAAELQTFLHERFPQADITVRTISSAGTITGIAIDSDIQLDAEITALRAAIEEKTSLKTADISVEVIGSSLGENFFKQTFIALIVAFFLMGITVIIYFRMLVPSLAVILAGFSDIIVTLAIFNVTGMKLSTAGVAAFLMLIGYSVDTDILLTSRVLKQHHGTVMERIYGAIKTGLTMTTTTLVAVAVALIFVKSDTIKQIMLIIFIGVLVDIIMTWIQNVAILRMYIERKHR